MILELNATPEDVMRAVEALQSFGRERRLGERDTFSLALALEECASNIVNHALRRDPRQKFQVAIEHAGDAVTIELRDHGPVFDPTRADVPHAGTPEDDHPGGGWGIQLVRRYMDEIHYAREGNQNVLRLTKKLVSGPRQD